MFSWFLDKTFGRTIFEGEAMIFLSDKYKSNYFGSLYFVCSIVVPS